MRFKRHLPVYVGSCLCILSFFAGGVFANALRSPSLALAKSPLLSASALASSCPAEFEALMTQMLQDLPAYANRVNTRANNPLNYVMLASRADFQELPLFALSHDSFSSKSGYPQVRQVFFTTLLRRYSNQTLVHQQEHHWLFLAPSDRGWEFVQLYSILDSYPSDSVSSAPRNSSEGALATAIKTWLNQCYPLRPT